MIRFTGMAEISFLPASSHDVSALAYSPNEMADVICRIRGCPIRAPVGLLLLTLDHGDPVQSGEPITL